MRMIDPNELLFSMSTIADDMAPLEQVSGESPAGLVFHEDEWRQVEFFDKSRLKEIQQKLKELKVFATANKQGIGFRKVYVRKLQPAPVLADPSSLSTLERELATSAKEGPVLYAGRSITGRVANGFALAIGRGVSLYGFHDRSGILVLGAIVENGGDDQALVRAFATLNARSQLILVDWRSQMLLLGVAKDGNIDVWQP
jgi:hypothetical protein